MPECWWSRKRARPSGLSGEFCEWSPSALVGSLVLRFLYAGDPWVQGILARGALRTCLPVVLLVWLFCCVLPRNGGRTAIGAKVLASARAMLPSRWVTD